LGEALGMSPSQLNTTNVDHPNSCEEKSKMMLRKWVEIKGVQIPLYTNTSTVGEIIS